MNKITPLLVGAALLVTAVLPVSAADTDPGIRAQNDGRPGSYYYRPTLRYYGKDYTVAYGFVPMDRRSSRAKQTFTDDYFTLTEAQVANSDRRGPRVVYTQRKPVSKVTPVKAATKTATR